MPKLYPNLSVEKNGEQMVAVTGEEVTADHANSKRYFIKDERPTDDEGFIGDVCFVISEEKIVPPEPEVLPPFELIASWRLLGNTQLATRMFDSSQYRNYMLIIQGHHTTDATGGTSINFRLMNGDDEDKTNTYTRQLLRVRGNGTAPSNEVFGTRVPNDDKTQIGFLSDAQGVLANGCSVMIYGPGDDKPTAIRGVDGDGRESASIYDFASTHSTAAAYDGFKVYTTATAWTGTMSLYGVRS